MAAIDFPSSPTVGDSVTSSEGRRWVWDGSIWQADTGVINTPFAAYTTVNTQTGTTYTFAIDDWQKLTSFTSSSSVTATIPLNSTTAYSVGTRLDMVQDGTGQVTIAGAVGVTLKTSTTAALRTQYSIASAIKMATDTWLIVGDLAVI